MGPWQEPVKAKPLLRAAGARDPRPRFAELCRLPKGGGRVGGFGESLEHPCPDASWLTQQSESWGPHMSFCKDPALKLHDCMIA